MWNASAVWKEKGRETKRNAFALAFATLLAAVVLPASADGLPEASPVIS